MFFRYPINCDRSAYTEDYDGLVMDIRNFSNLHYKQIGIQFMYKKISQMELFEEQII